MDYVRTPDDRFKNLPDYDFAPNYIEVDAGDGTNLRMHYLDECPRDGQLILCLHGQPSWSFLYRKMIPLLTSAGHRVIAPDLVGFGRSDKPTRGADYTYANHSAWLRGFIEKLDLQAITLVCQDWGGLLGLRLAGLSPERFARLVIANTGLPDTRSVPDEAAEFLAQLAPDIPVPDAAMVGEKFAAGAPGAFLYWVKFAAEGKDFSARNVFATLSSIDDAAILNGYEAPFPDETYMVGARRFPSLVPLLPEHKPDREANQKAWQGLEKFGRPVLTAFADNDPVTKGGEKVFQTRIPGASGVNHVTIKGGGHFLQEAQPKAFADAINDFIATTR